MEYKALYREYRPKTFDEVIGQKHVVEALRNSVKYKRIAHAYLFAGTRGTGKTSVARIFARAVNCLDINNGNPCNECHICKGILTEKLLDVIEIDAASNNSVDNIREIREEVVYLPVEARCKVYIIDEVHMLSPGAFNALLKTLEEPPPHVIFILATTEPNKLPATILSRCQRYDFKRISIDDIYIKLSMICADSGTEAEEKALRLIARVADGAMRDAQSILDKCISGSRGKLRFSDVHEIVGISDTETISAIINDVLEGRIDGIIDKIDKVERNGTDLKYFVTETTEYLRNLLVCVLADDPFSLIMADDEAVKVMDIMAKKIGKAGILKLIRKMSELAREIRTSQKPRILIEVALIDEASGNGTESIPDTAAGTREDPEETLWEDVKNQLMGKGEKLIIAYLSGTRLTASGNRYTIFFMDADIRKKETIEKHDNLIKIKKSIMDLAEKDDIFLKCALDGERKSEAGNSFSEDGIKAFFKDVPINIVDGG